MTPRRPPRLAEWLLSARVSPADRSMVLGDMAEQFQQHDRQSGRVRAAAWYWREATGLGLGLSWIEPRERLATGRVMAMDDVRYAWRRLRKQPATSLVSIVTLACAIGAAAASWSLISTVLLNPVRIPEPERVVRVQNIRDSDRGPIVSTGFNYPGASAIREAQLLPLAMIGSIGARSPLMVEINGVKTNRGVRFTSPNFLDIIDVRPQLGRYFGEADSQPDAPLVAVVSDRFWRRDLAADPNVIGREILLRGRPTRIIGVLPRHFRGLDVSRNPDLYMPLRTIEYVQGWDNLFGERPPVYWVHLVGRLPDGVSAATMQARFNSLDVSTVSSLEGRTFALVDAQTAAIAEATRADLRRFATLLGSTVALLLAIGSLTVGTLLLMRTEARRSEFATCLALGASRRRLAAGVAFDGAFLTGLGVLLALPVSQLMFNGIGAFELPGGIRLSILDLAIDRQVFAGAAVAAGLSVLAIGAVASLFALRGDLGFALRSQGATPRLAQRRSRAALVTAQVAVALVLVSGASLFATSLSRALSLNPSFDSGVVLEGSVAPGGLGYDQARQSAFFESLQRRLSDEPAVASFALSVHRFGTRLLIVDGQEQRFGASVSLTGVGEGFFDTLGLPISAGRAFTRDDRAGTPNVAIVSASLGRALGGGHSPLGRRISAVNQGLSNPAEVVGVVPDVAHPLSLEPHALYLPSSQYSVTSYPGDGGVELMVRPARDRRSAERAVVETLKALEPALVFPAMTTLDERILESMAPQQFGLTVMGALGAVALILSVLGAYVLAESAATARRREIGIRAALGGSGRHLRAVLLSETFRLVGAGLLVGFGLSWAGAGTIRAFLFQVEPLDPWITAGVAMLILFLALAVSLRPALAATRMDLARVLRDD